MQSENCFVVVFLLFFFVFFFFFFFFVFFVFFFFFCFLFVCFFVLLFCFVFFFFCFFVFFLLLFFSFKYVPLFRKETIICSVCQLYSVPCNCTYHLFETAAVQQHKPIMDKVSIRD